MSTSVTLPALGESVTEGTVTRWLKQDGDKVEVDEPLLEVSTDKVDTEIPSPVAGMLLEIMVAEDETVEVGAVLAVIGDAGESDVASRPARSSRPARPTPAPRTRPTPRPRPQAEARRASRASRPRAASPSSPREPEQPAADRSRRPATGVGGGATARR